jgi:hypothetical protein
LNINLDNTGTAHVRSDATQRLSALNIGDGGTATLTAGGDKVLVLDRFRSAARRAGLIFRITTSSLTI